MDKSNIKCAVYSGLAVDPAVALGVSTAAIADLVTLLVSVVVFASELVSVIIIRLLL